MRYYVSMEQISERQCSVSETDDELEVIIRYKQPDISKIAANIFSVKLDNVDDDGSVRSERIIPIEDPEYVDASSSMLLRSSNGFLHVILDTPTPNTVADVGNLFANAGIFMADDTTNYRIAKFLNRHFPDDYERNAAHEAIKAEYDANCFDGYLMSEEFWEPKDRPESFYPTLLMLTAYAFPALHHHFSIELDKGLVMGMFSDMKLGYQDFMSAPTESALADMALGARRKFFRKISEKMTVSELALVHQLSKIVSVDDIDIALSNFDFTAERGLVEAWYRDLDQLNNFSPTVRRRLIRSLFQGYQHTDDAFDMVARYAEDYSFFKGVSTIEELHDRTLQIIPEVNEEKRIEKVDSSILANLELSIPGTEFMLRLLVNHGEFLRTGKELSTCIGSARYFEESLNGDSYCYQIFDGDTLIGALQVKKVKNSWKVLQIGGVRTAKLDCEQAISSTLLESLESFDSSSQRLVDANF